MIIVELGDIFLTVDHIALKKLKLYIQDLHFKPEAGGILMGYYIDEFSYHITDITIPSKFDKGSRFSFIRTIKNAQKILSEYFQQSNGKKIYLGEWHTHPEKNPTPSSLDLYSMESQMNKNILNSNTIFMIIMGTEGLFVSSFSKSGLLNQKRVSYN